LENLVARAKYAGVGFSRNVDDGVARNHAVERFRREVDRGHVHLLKSGSRDILPGSGQHCLREINANNLKSGLD
jgi:hypothetical protein